MLIWIFNLLDSFALIFLTLAQFNLIFSPMLLTIAGIYLIFKGAAFFGDLMSTIDLVIGLYLILIATFHLAILPLYLLILFWFLYKIGMSIMQ